MRALTLKWFSAAARGAVGQGWGIRLQRGYRGWARRWGWALLACLMAWALGMWLHSQTWLDHAQAQRDVRTLQAQLAAVPAGRPARVGLEAGSAITPLPTADQRGQMWSLLPGHLAKHQVRLLAMQAVNEAMAGPLPSEAMALRLQARFENWAGLWSVLAQMGPVWSMDRLRVVPSAGLQGVDIEVVWRIWSTSAALAKPQDGDPWAEAFTHWPAPRLSNEGPSIFDGVRSPLATQVAAAASPLTDAAQAPAAPPLPQGLMYSSEPERWPMLPLRLIGIWQQADRTEAWVANDSHWSRVEEGRQLSQAGHRVWRIGQDEVQVRDRHGQVQSLKMEAQLP